MSKSISGVMIVKNGLGWGITYQDGHATSYGWVHIDDANIHDDQCCKKPEDVTYAASPHVHELRTAKLVHATRTTITTLHPESLT